jgi:hypothetical protein
MKKTTKKPKRRSGDVNVTAFNIVNELTDEKPVKKKKQKPAKSHQASA